MSRPQSPLQEAILTRVSQLEQVREQQLCDFLGNYFRGLDVADAPWQEEFALAVDLLVLYGHLRVSEIPRKGRYLTLASAPPVFTDLPQHDKKTATTTATLSAASAATIAIVAAGCSLLPPSQIASMASLPPYSVGTGYPYRIEQFIHDRRVVYRYCANDECPQPTQKFAARSPSSEAPPYGTAGYARQQEATAKSAVAPVTLAASLLQVKGGTSSGASAPGMQAPGSLGLRADNDFTSYKGMVGFQRGSMVLDGLSRQKVSELAPMARDAERVRLRGRVASSQLTEDMKKLAVGRAYAVKVEFGKHDVDKAKIRILNPQQANAENATGTVRGVDVMLDMPEKKSLSGMVKDDA